MNDAFKRAVEERIVLIAGAFCLFGLAPLILLHASLDDWPLVLLEMVAALAVTLLMIHIYRTHQYRLASLLLAIVYVFGVASMILIQGVSALHLFYPAVIVAYLLVAPNVALIITLTAVAVVTPALVGLMEFVPYFRFALSLLGCIFLTYFFATNRNRQRDELLEISRMDPLTGAGNRRALDQKLSETIQLHQRKPMDSCLLLLDLDNFKRVNDRLGHIVGDEILVRVTQVVQARIRVTDRLYRYGGDEFVVLATNCDLKTSLRLAEDLRALVERSEEGSDSGVSISLGIAQYAESQTPDQWLISADQALFSAKRAGRNQIASSTVSQVTPG
ncbi:MAG: GGDEF domain-containing protein [Pseudomonadales bacterium]|nr:GGDEF domain-containing protein [Pseudomonadales bacterium]